MFIRVIFLCLAIQLVCGDDIAQRLIDRYNDVITKCVDKNNNARPAYECSGIILRGVSKIGQPGSEQKYAWSKKSSNIRRNAFSAAFLRKDQQFSGLPLGHNSGFFYYPYMEIPSEKNTYPVICAYPIDGFTDFRNGTGCGISRIDSTNRSGDCALQGINTFTKWQAHYQDVTNGSDERFGFPMKQCFFNMTSDDSANKFELLLEAKEYLGEINPRYTYFNNEIIIAAWDDADLDKFPIEAFFYALDSSKGRAEAKMYQNDYLELTGKTIPVVGIRFPNTNNPNFTVILDE